MLYFLPWAVLDKLLRMVSQLNDNKAKYSTLNKVVSWLKNSVTL